MVPSSPRFPVLIDTDPGVDDAWAILFLAAQRNVEILGLGTIHGNVPTEVSAANALRILDVAGLTAVPVAIGAPKPLQQPLATAEFVHGPDGLGGQAGPASQRQPTQESAAEQIVRLARQRPGEVTLLCLAPLTNLALALRLEPALPSLLRHVVYMGGAIRVPGNLTAWADANTGHDPEAGEEVFRAGFRMTVIPMDVTARAWADKAWLDAVAAAQTPAAQFATRILDTYVGIYTQLMGQHGCLMHDPLAAAIMLDPSLAEYEEKQILVELAGHCRGRTLIDDRGFPPEMSSITDGRPPVRIARSVDAQAAMDRIRNAFTGC
ncbi:nucleoside hydrolase [Streptomyces sp. NPDC012888]|uniref:nucleoside hydrolase n=1 Tax=Streptomyces sp. NPDC012888 TaxID=3364855 RepID=UPI0036AECCC6